MTRAPASRALPTAEIARLVDEQGLKGAWCDLIVTHAVKSFSPAKARLLRADTEYKKGRVLPEDLLADRSVGQISVLYEFSLAHVDRDARRESGQYFTPDDVAAFMASQVTLFPDDSTWLDPCSGVGNLSHALAATQANPEEFIAERLYLVDRDPVALMIARALLFLHFHQTRDSLLDDLKGQLWRRDFLEDTDLPEFDYAIVNPPYAQAPAEDRFITSKARDLYAYFLERLCDISDGFIAITPQSFTHGAKFDTLRALLLNTYAGLRLYCFDNVPNSIFSGVKFGSTNTNMSNSVRACVTVARKSPKEHRITPLLRWSAAERAHMFKTVTKKLGPSQFTKDMFPKNFPELGSLYTQVTGPGYNPLKNVLSDTVTPWALTVPSTPRYFAPAVKRHLNRTSFHTIYFPSEQTRDTYYAYLNSSALYWWWRVHDGGMSISLATLESLPVPAKPKQSKSLTARLQESEAENLVIKMNAGKPIENVKHPQSLVEDLNRFYFGDPACAALMFVHQNTYFA